MSPAARSPIAAIVIATVLGLALYTALSTASSGLCPGSGSGAGGCVSVVFTPSPVAQGLIILVGVVFVLLVRRVVVDRADAGVPETVASADRGAVRRLATRAVILLAVVPIVLVLVQHAGWFFVDVSGWRPGETIQVPFFSHGTVSYRTP